MRIEATGRVVAEASLWASHGDDPSGVTHGMAVPARRDRGAWLATTARRECLTSFRRAARCRPSDEVDVLADEEFAGADTRLLRHWE